MELICKGNKLQRRGKVGVRNIRSKKKALFLPPNQPRRGHQTTGKSEGALNNMALYMGGGRGTEVTYLEYLIKVRL